MVFEVVVAFADGEGMFNWNDPCGYTCYQWADGSGDCYPCLTEECEVCYVETPEASPTPNPIPTPTPEPTPDPTPEKVSCNRGLGNGAEDCDPGNSGGKPGSAGEDNE